MSWTKRESPYEDFKEQSALSPRQSQSPRWALKVWEVTTENPLGHWFDSSSAQCLQSKARLRIVFALLDLPRADNLSQTLELFNALGIPSEFATERIQSVSHSFGRRTDTKGSSSWFHSLQKNIDIKPDGNNGFEVDNVAARMGYPPSTLPQANYSWHRSGYFLRSHTDGDIVLVCFGALPKVRKRLEEFAKCKAWEEVAVDPYIMFDLILEGLYLEIDNTVWKMNQVFSSLEHTILENAGSRQPGENSKISFVGLHNCAKHIVYLAESLQSNTMVTEATLADVGSHPVPTSPSRDLVIQQLKENLNYRLSLHHSTRLRLSSLQKRVDNTLALAFHLVTDQTSMVMMRDSKLMIQESKLMKIIAAMTMIFLPTTAVATVIGSQLLVSEMDQDDGSWTVSITPLFWMTWWITIPLTLLVVLAAGIWHWSAFSESRSVLAAVKRVAAFTAWKDVKKFDGKR